MKRRARARDFVGRRAELEHLKRLFETTSHGQGALVMLVGEPGIGKTALCEQLCAFVVEAGGQALVGHCYAEGSFRPPYQPFVEALDTYVQECDPEVVATDLGSSAVELGRILPTLRQRSTVAPGPSGDPEEDRWRLLQAVTHLLRSAATRQPLLLVLEDLHDADRGTLDMLLHLARSLHGARVLVVGTYRDVEVDRAPTSGGTGRIAPCQPVRAHTSGRAVGRRGPTAVGGHQPAGRDTPAGGGRASSKWGQRPVRPRVAPLHA
ncbi:MAG TPA: ATP-binding protein [Solirubrobacteraceae bacterium]